MIAQLRLRKKPEKHEKYISEGSQVINTKRKIYEYYKCDYCGEDIEIKENKAEQTGGTVKVKGTILALHNKCLKPFLKKEEI